MILLQGKEVQELEEAVLKLPQNACWYFKGFVRVSTETSKPVQISVEDQLFTGWAVSEKVDNPAGFSITVKPIKQLPILKLSDTYNLKSLIAEACTKSGVTLSSHSVIPSFFTGSLFFNGDLLTLLKKVRVSWHFLSSGQLCIGSWPEYKPLEYYTTRRDGLELLTLQQGQLLMPSSGVELTYVTDTSLTCIRERV